MNTMTQKDTLLIVDDMPDNVTLLRRFLNEAGFRVLVANNGETGIRTAEYAKPDLILLDVMMPVIDGFNVCQALKEREITRDIPIIFMTALSDTVDKVKGLKLGAEDYVTKPIQHEEVLARIRTHIKLRKQQQQIQQQNEILQQRNQDLDMFAQMVAHDLKNPLSGVITLTDILAQTISPDRYPEARTLKQLDILARTSRRMMSIINALLTLAGVSNQSQPVLEAVDMAAIVQQVLQVRLAHLIAEHQAEVELPEQWPLIHSYPPWIEEVWANYLSNGIKYGGSPPKLTLGAEKIEGNHVKFWVKDNGNGLAESEQARLFLPFTRLHHHSIEGHGLGLSIVKKIAEKLGGKAGVISEKNQGSLFYFILPYNMG
ncbi:sensor histidine kinase [Thioflexithrix psekupsensis]|uniref:histidine kinase n=1 Tax=Thioflexithrix psekupsensis TaxID=1570016 RepID=A0A251X924_9GAMM|nr:hybrid sensor histidine kinase/response regulator [Thioflexithrix psekupsensis]OUD14227.1 hybrid sensor histidine kinase/response regulator [Thioflexithrix psekupsensis]